MILFSLLLASATLELRATSLTEALPKIGAAYGVVMRAAPAIGEEIVLARLDAAELDAAGLEETKAHLADAFSAEWSIARDGTLVLAPSAKRREAERQDWYALRRGRIARRLAELRKESEALSPFDANVAVGIHRRMLQGVEEPEFDRFRVPTPERRLLLRLLATLRPEAFDTDRPLTRIVFSLTPTELQRPLGPDVANALRDYREESSLWNAVHNAPVEGSPVEGSTVDREAHSAPPERGPATRILLDASTYDLSTRVSMTLFDAAGGWVDSAEEEFSNDTPEHGQKVPFQIPPDSSSAPYDLSPLVRQGGEPLSFDVSDVLLSAARTAGRSTIVAPGDRLLKPERGRVLAGDLGNWIGSDCGRVTFDTPRWMSVRTEHPYVAHATFFPRSRLRQTVRLLARASPPSLAMVLEYARLRPDWPSEVLGDRLLQAAYSGGGPYANPADLRLPAALSPGEWSAAARGPIPIAALNARARVLAGEVLYGPGEYGRRKDVIVCGSGLAGWGSEPTNLIATVRPMLRLDRQNALAVGTGVGGNSRLLPVDRFLLFWRVEEFTKRENDTPSVFGFEHLRFFERPEWNLSLSAGANSGEWITLEDTPVPLDSGTYTRNTIPPAIRRRLNLKEGQ